MDQPILLLAEQIGEFLKEKKLLLATAESCTGGWVSQVVTAVSGSSSWFERGFVTYSDASKFEMLGVHEQTLRQHGAVSRETVIEMAEGALRYSHAHVSLAITGIAGPTGGTIEKPVGLVWISWGCLQFASIAKQFNFTGTREEIRYQAVETALKGIVDYLNQNL